MSRVWLKVGEQISEFRLLPRRRWLLKGSVVLLAFTSSSLLLQSLESTRRMLALVEEVSSHHTNSAFPLKHPSSGWTPEDRWYLGSRSRSFNAHHISHVNHNANPWTYLTSNAPSRQSAGLFHMEGNVSSAVVLLPFCERSPIRQRGEFHLCKQQRNPAMTADYAFIITGNEQNPVTNDFCCYTPRQDKLKHPTSHCLPTKQWFTPPLPFRTALYFQGFRENPGAPAGKTFQQSALGSLGDIAALPSFKGSRILSLSVLLSE